MGYEWAQLRPPAAPYPLGPDCHGCPRVLERPALYMPPLFMSRVVYDDVCTCDLCLLIPFQPGIVPSAPRTKTTPGLFPLKSSSSPCQGASSQAEQEWQPFALQGGQCPPGPGPEPCLPLCPAPGSSLMSRAGTNTGTYRCQMRKGAGRLAWS